MNGALSQLLAEGGDVYPEQMPGRRIGRAPHLPEQLLIEVEPVPWRVLVRLPRSGLPTSSQTPQASSMPGRVPTVRVVPAFDVVEQRPAGRPPVDEAVLVE